MTGAIIALMDVFRLTLLAVKTWLHGYETARIKRQLESEIDAKNRARAETALAARNYRRARDANPDVLREDDGFRRD